MPALRNSGGILAFELLLPVMSGAAMQRPNDIPGATAVASPSWSSLSNYYLHSVWWRPCQVISQLSRASTGCYHHGSDYAWRWEKHGARRILTPRRRYNRSSNGSRRRSIRMVPAERLWCASAIWLRRAAVQAGQGAGRASRVATAQPPRPPKHQNTPKPGIYWGGGFGPLWSSSNVLSAALLAARAGGLPPGSAPVPGLALQAGHVPGDDAGATELEPGRDS